MSHLTQKASEKKHSQYKSKVTLFQQRAKQAVAQGSVEVTLSTHQTDIGPPLLWYSRGDNSQPLRNQPEGARGRRHYVEGKLLGRLCGRRSSSHSSCPLPGEPLPGSCPRFCCALDLVDCVSRQDEQRASGPWHIGQYRALALNGLQLLHLSDCRRRCRTSSSVLSGRSNRFFCNRETGLQLCQIIRALLKARETMVWNF